MKQAFSVNRWYELLKQCTFETEFVALSEEEVSPWLPMTRVAKYIHFPWLLGGGIVGFPSPNQPCHQ